MKSRLTIYLFNLLIAILCLAAIVLYFLYPLWRISIHYTLDSETVENMFSESGVDLGNAIDEDLTIKISFELDSLEIVKSVREQEITETVNQMITTNVDRILEELIVYLEDIAETVFISYASDTIKTEIKTQIKNFLQIMNPEITDEEVVTLLNDAGATDEYLSEKTQSFLDEIFAENATLESVTDKALTETQGIFTTLAESGKPEFTFLVFTEENREAIENSVQDMLQDVCQEDDSIDANKFVAIFLLEFVRTLNSSEEAPESVDVSSMTREEIEEEIKTELHTFLLNMIPEEAYATVRIVLIVIAGILLFSCLTWAYLILKMLIKLFMKNPAIKLKLPIWLGWLPFLLFRVVPTAALHFLPSIAPELAAGFTGMSLTFFSSGFFAFAAAVILIILWIPYGILRKSKKRK